MLGKPNIDRPHVDRKVRREVDGARGDGATAVDRREARRAATKAEIVDAAWALAREEGLGALSLRELAARVGMRAPSLYQYFASKHAIYDAMFGQAARKACDALPAPDTDGKTSRDTLYGHAHRFFEFAVSDPARAQLLFQRTIPGFEPSSESYAPAVELLERLHTWLDASGITDPDAADLWTAMIGGLVSQQLANDPGGDRWGRLVDRTVDMFLDAMGPAPGPASKNRKRPRRARG